MFFEALHTTYCNSFVFIRFVEVFLSHHEFFMQFYLKNAFPRLPLLSDNETTSELSYLFLEKNESVFKLSLSQALGQWGCSKKQAGDERGLGSSPLTESLEQANMFLTLNNLWVADLDTTRV